LVGKSLPVIDQLSEANVDKGRITVVVMAEAEKMAMEDELREKVRHLNRIKLVVRSGSSVSLHDLAKVSFDRAQAIVILIDDKSVTEPNRADGRVIKTLMAIYNHPDGRGRVQRIRVTAEVMTDSRKSRRRHGGRAR
jgi:hypothetical protein